jgi:hypothetical protein
MIFRISLKCNTKAIFPNVMSAFASILILTYVKKTLSHIPYSHIMLINSLVWRIYEYIIKITLKKGIFWVKFIKMADLTANSIPFEKLLSDFKFVFVLVVAFA